MLPDARKFVGDAHAHAVAAAGAVESLAKLSLHSASRARDACLPTSVTTVSFVQRAANSSHGNDLTRGEVVEVPWIGGVMARTVGIGIVVEHCVQAKVVEIRKRKAWTSVKEMVGRKVVEIDAVVSIIGIKPILVAQVEVVDEALVSQIAVVAKGRAVRELKIINAVA